MVVSLGFLLVYLQQKQTYKSKAEGITPVTCRGQIAVWVSADAVNWSTRVDLPSSPSKYYLKSTENGLPCSTNFDAYSRYCSSSGVCNGWRETDRWGIYRSNSSGIARIDLDTSLLGSVAADGVYQAYFRPAGTAFNWSNLISVNVG